MASISFSSSSVFSSSHNLRSDSWMVAGLITSYLPEADEDIIFKKPIINNLFIERIRILGDSEASHAFCHDLNWMERPRDTKCRIDKAFQSIRGHSSSMWSRYNGSDRYEMCGIDDGSLLKTIIKEAPVTKKEFYALDVGAGNFQWGEDLADFINKKANIRRDITVHIISVRGESSYEEKIIRSGQCIRYNLGEFKIEEMLLELHRHGFSLENNLDIGISRWCFRHLVDPVGTFAQVFNLLRPGAGVFLGDGFFFLHQKQSWHSYIHSNTNTLMIDLLLDTKAPFLMNYYNATRSMNHFIVKRLDSNPCSLPMSYIESCCISDEVQCGSETVTRFRKWNKTYDPFKFNMPMPAWRSGYEALHGSRSLFNWLQTNRLISEEIKWQSIQEPTESKVSAIMTLSPNLVPVLPLPLKLVDETEVNIIEEMHKLLNSVSEVP